jgi:predicted N-acyltransferase
VPQSFVPTTPPGPGPDAATGGQITLSLHDAITDIDAAAWDACAGSKNPFVSHGFLTALEKSGSVSAAHGWRPLHAAFRDTTGTLLACAPAYIKSHSYGEYVFDHGWARAFEQAGGRYYPKWQICSPFSPVPGPRLLRRPNAPAIDMLANALIGACEKMRLSSLHLSFCTEDEYDTLGKQGFLQRLGLQYHWHNQGYNNFDDFLATLSARKRKTLKRERRDAQNCGLSFRTLLGRDISESHWDAFYRFYQLTIDRKWGSAYLTRDFFSRLSENLGERVVLMMAFDGTKPVAGALNLMGEDTLYGRNWGAIGDYPFLHFELCYYRAIDFAIAHKLARVEAGAQGEHKIQRGYLPQKTFSAHYISHPGLCDAVHDFLVHERAGIIAEMAGLTTLSPYRGGGA